MYNRVFVPLVSELPPKLADPVLERRLLKQRRVYAVNGSTPSSSTCYRPTTRAARCSSRCSPTTLDADLHQFVQYHVFPTRR